ncbi:radical SAM protein [Desulfobulbus sp. US1]|nr:radical SAM protein [Desulfobulbus sp. US1]MCW5213854.1 radical SAM protein [Desulfobulbus sp. US5]
MMNPEPLLVIPVFIPHEGCPHCCVFCNQRRISGFTEKSVTAEDVRVTVQTWLDRDGPAQRRVQVAFYGGSFTGLPLMRQKELLGAVAPFLEQGRVQSLRLSTRPDYIDQERVDLLGRYQVSTVELGVQSMNDRVLALAKRGHCAADVDRAVPVLRQAGMEIGIQLLLGLPGDTRTTLRQTVERVIALQPDFIRIYPLLVVQHSELAEQYKRGEYTPFTLDKGVVLAAWMKQRFDQAGIRVVRMGLQAGPELESSLLAGPWHPAFGELVASRLMLRRMRKLLAQVSSEGMVQVHINERDQSVFRGMKSANVKRLQQLGLWQRIVLSTDSSLLRGTVRVLS